MIERDELYDQHAVVGRLGDREMEIAARARIRVGVIDQAFRFREQPLQPCVVGWRRVLRGKLGRERFDGALRVHHLGGADAGKIELNCERLREQPRIAAGDPRASALAHADLGDPERLQRP